MANPARMIYRYPRYAELYAAHERAEAPVATGSGVFGPQEFRDLQVLSQLAWFDEEFQEHDPEVRALVAKGRNFTSKIRRSMGRKQREICARVIPEYRKLAESGPDRDLHHAVLPSDSAAALRQRYRLGLASACSAAAALLLSRRRAHAARRWRAIT